LLQNGEWVAEKVISIPSKKVEGWALPEMPGTQDFTSKISATSLLFFVLFF
jgi:hypothetical protein